MAIQIELLKSIPYFSGLNPADLESIGKLTYEKAADRGEIILVEGEPSEAIFFVASGVVKVIKTSAEGKEQILNIVRPGGSFNDVPILDSGPNLASAQAMGPVVLYGIKRTALETVLQERPQIALNVIRVLSQKIVHLVSLVEDLSFRHVIGRLAKILLEYTGNGSDTRPRLTQQEMAAMVGTAREMIGRSLKTLEENGAIRLDRHRILIANKEILKEMVEQPS